MAKPDNDSKSMFERGIAIFACIAAALYLLGLLHVRLTVSEVGEGTQSTPMRECVSAPNLPHDARVLEHEVRFVPLHIMCRTTDGRLFTSPVVPSWFNPAIAISFAATVACAAGSVVQANRRERLHDRGR